jgi:hypothetical protein
LADNEADATDWRARIINYLHNPSFRTYMNVRRTTFKYVLVDDELYRQIVDDVLLRCLGLDDVILLWPKYMRVFVVLINWLRR